MFCPTCGKPDQTPDTYCRSCGQFLNSSRTTIAFGGVTPLQNLNVMNVISLIAAIASLVVGVFMYLTNFSVPLLLYLAAAILLCNAGWQLSNFAIGMRLKHRLKRAKEGLTEQVRSMPATETRELLNPANADDAVPSVTESTTRQLHEKVRGGSSPSEQ